MTHLYSFTAWQTAYDRGGRPLSWILTMTRNLCLMQLRRKSRTEVSAEDLEFPETENPFATAEDRMILPDRHPLSGRR